MCEGCRFRNDPEGLRLFLEKYKRMNIRELNDVNEKLFRSRLLKGIKEPTVKKPKKLKIQVSIEE